jgi:hypothetical protein
MIGVETEKPEGPLNKQVMNSVAVGLRGETIPGDTRCPAINITTINRP